MAETATGSGQSRTTHRQRAAPKFNYIILKLLTLPYTYFWARRPSHFAKINCMSAELMMWFVLATKMAVTALFVTAATIIAERLGATVGALVATLPVSAGPVYVFLALDHDSTFISSSAVASLALNSATAIYLTAYVLIAQRRSMWLSISLAFAMWLAAVLVFSRVQWAAWSASALNVIVFTACTFIV